MSASASDIIFMALIIALSILVLVAINRSNDLLKERDYYVTQTSRLCNLTNSDVDLINLCLDKEGYSPVGKLNCTVLLEYHGGD